MSRIVSLKPRYKVVRILCGLKACLHKREQSETMLIVWLLLAFRADKKYHPFTFEVRHVVRFSVVREVSGETCEKEFALLFKHDRTSAEEDICFDFVTFLEKLLGVLEFKVVIVVICLRSEPNFLDLLFLLVRFRLLLFFLLCVKELLIVDNATNGRIRRSRYFDEIEVLLVSNFHCLLE